MGENAEAASGVCAKEKKLRSRANGLLTSEQTASLQQRPLYKLLAVVVVPQRLEWLTNDLKLDDEQKEKARGILHERREKFLALVDSSPPPSLSLSRLALIAQRLGEPKEIREVTRREIPLTLAHRRPDRWRPVGTRPPTLVRGAVSGSH